MVLKYIFVFFTLITSSICHATCDRTETGSHPDFEANKKWPMHPHITISASASFQQAASYDDGFLDLLVEIKDSKTKKLSYYCAKNALSSDAMAIHKISIDTAPYILSKSTHAFGVRSYNSNNSQSNPASIQTITLFGVRDGKVVLLLDTIDMGGHFNEVSLREECKGTFITQKRIISISKTTHNGLSDLEVTESGIL